MATPRQLITVIVNAGFGADVMDVARKAGATGGTLLSASGTGTAEDVKFFGVTLVPEKDMLMILADGDKAPSILSAIRTFPALSAPGGGIVYCVDVSEAFALGARADG